MNQAALKLESFLSKPSFGSGPEIHTDLEESYNKGLAEGQKLGASAEFSSLAGSIRTLEISLEDAAKIRREAAAETATDLMAVFAEVISALARGDEASGLQNAVQEEVRRIAQGVATPQWYLSCPPRLEPMIRRCIAEAGLEEADIRIDPDQTEVSILMESRRSTFASQGVAKHFRDLLTELEESYR